MEHGLSEASNQSSLGFNTTLSIGPVITSTTEQSVLQRNKHKSEDQNHEATDESILSSPSDLKANNKHGLLPLFTSGGSSRGLNLNMPAAEEEEEEEGQSLISVEGSYDKKRDGDDEKGAGSKRKKLRLSQEQYSFLENSFQDHKTLNPKQKIALAEKLHLRPRQVEVWFQNRRARTKLKQILLECEHLKKWCDTLEEENARLHKEIQELRALKTSSSLDSPD